MKHNKEICRSTDSHITVINFGSPSDFKDIVSQCNLDRVDDPDFEYRPQFKNYRIDYYDGNTRLIIEYPSLIDVFFHNGVLSSTMSMGDDDIRWLMKMAAKPSMASPYLLHETRHWIPNFLITNRIEFHVEFTQSDSRFRFYATSEEDLLQYKLST